MIIDRTETVVPRLFDSADHLTDTLKTFCGPPKLILTSLNI